jgi:hypothetical protein
MRQAYYPVRVVCATLDAPPFHGRNTDHRAASPSFKIAGSIRESSEDSLWHPGRRKNTIFRSWRLCYEFSTKLSKFRSAVVLSSQAASHHSIDPKGFRGAPRKDDRVIVLVGTFEFVDDGARCAVDRCCLLAAHNLGCSPAACARQLSQLKSRSVASWWTRALHVMAHHHFRSLSPR